MARRSRDCNTNTNTTIPILGGSIPIPILRKFVNTNTIFQMYWNPCVAPLRFAPAFRALGVCEHIWLRYKNFDPSCFDPIQKSEYVDLRTNFDFRSRYFDLFPPTLLRVGSSTDCTSPNSSRISSKSVEAGHIRLTWILKSPQHKMYSDENFTSNPWNSSRKSCRFPEGGR